MKFWKSISTGGLGNTRCRYPGRGRRTSRVLLRSALLFAGISFQAHAQDSNAQAAPPAAIPTFSTEDIARQAFFYIGGHYVGDPGKEIMHGAMYVEVLVPKKIRHPYPIVYLHGAGQTATDWLQTPDGRAGWAYYFAKQGYVQYLEDYPTRGRSAYVPGVDGKLTIRPAPQLEKIWTALQEKGDWPQAKKGGAWPGKGTMGDPVFDNFVKTQVQFLQDNVETEKLNLDANTALLDTLGTPVILILHSQGGASGFELADARPNLVKGLIGIEPAAPPLEAVYLGSGKALIWGLTNLPVHYDPPIHDPSELQVVKQDQPDQPDLVACWIQTEPARQLINLAKIPVLEVSGEASYHRMYDHCDAKWLNQAGVKTTFLKPEDLGIHGNGHEMMLEKNSDEIAKYLESWIERNIH
jgi:pimeloyl-ACP methyl ester carboxylesterase